MKNKKFILLILVMLLFSGCTVNYNLYINNDLSVNEKITATEDVDTLKINTGQDPDIAAKSIYNFYKKDDVNYSFSNTLKGNDIISNVSASFNSLEEYEEYFSSNIVKEVNITKDKDLITLNYKQDVPLSNNSEKTLIYDSIKVNINIPFKVVESNADYKSGNTYTWEIKKEELKDIKISFNVKETKNSKKFNFGFFEINVKYSVAFVLGFIAVILLIALFINYKNKKNNRI